jgi:hypothetical protein
MEKFGLYCYESQNFGIINLHKNTIYDIISSILILVIEIHNYF